MSRQWLWKPQLSACLLAVSVAMDLLHNVLWPESCSLSHGDHCGRSDEKMVSTNTLIGQLLLFFFLMSNLPRVYVFRSSKSFLHCYYLLSFLISTTVDLTPSI